MKVQKLLFIKKLLLTIQKRTSVVSESIDIDKAIIIIDKDLEDKGDKILGVLK